MPKHSLYDKYQAWLWRQDDRPSRLPVLGPISRKILRIGGAVFRDVVDGDLALRATSLVYATLLSLAPLLAISFSVLKGMGVHNQLEPFLKSLLEPLGDQSGDVAERLTGFVGNIQVGVLGAVGVATLFFSVLMLMGQIEQAFNSIWRVTSQRSFGVRLRDYLVVLLIGPLFLFLSMAMTASLTHSDFVARYLPFAFVETSMRGVFAVVPYLLFIAAFTALYMFMPNTRVRLWPALAAALLTAVAWKGLGILFGVFVAGSANYAAIYSAFAALILFMIWLYTAWLIVLAGASVSYYLQHPANQRAASDWGKLTPQMNNALALQLVHDIGQHFYAGKQAFTLEDLARRAAAPSAIVEAVVEPLVACGLLVHDDAKPPHYLPGRPLDETSIAELMQMAEGCGTPAMDRIRLDPAVFEILAKRKAVLDEAFSDENIKTMAKD